MNELLGRVVSFGKTVFRGQYAPYPAIAPGQGPGALMNEGEGFPAVRRAAPRQASDVEFAQAAE